MYDGTLMKIINFGMHGWVIGLTVLEAHPFTINLFDVYCRVKVVIYHSHGNFFVSPCTIIVPPCIFDSILHFLESLYNKLSENVYFYTLQVKTS